MPSKTRVISIRWIVTGAVMALVTSAVVAMGWFGEKQTREALARELETRLVLEARNLALTSVGALLSDYPELTLQPIIAEMMGRANGLAYALVADHEEVIRAHPDARLLGTKWVASSDLAVRETGVSLREGEQFLADAALFVATSPVRHPSGDRIGSATVAVTRGAIEATILAARRKQLLLTAVLVAGGIAISYLLLSMLLRPIRTLREGLERIGRGDLNSPVRLKDRTELGLLAETMNEMSAQLREAQTEMVEKERLAHELELAREIQGTLLPKERLCTPDFVVEGNHRDAAEVGGDFYDYFSLPNGEIGLVIADVSGKGLAGCLVASMLSALLNAFRGEGGSPRSTLLLVEKYLVKLLRPGTFVTMFYGALDPRTGRLTFVSAGHNPLMIYRAATREVEVIKTRGIPLGAVRGSAFAKSLEERSVEVHPGDVVVQYTDGVTEAFDPSGQNQFGPERLQKTITAAASRGGHSVLEAIRDQVEKWAAGAPRSDDETLLVFSRAAASAESLATAAASPVRPETAKALELLGRARRIGKPLVLRSRLDSLAGIGDWLSTRPEITALRSSERSVLETALFEACANVVEHGYGEDPSQTLDLWWIPGGVVHAGNQSLPEIPVERVRFGYFILADRGEQFVPKNNEPVDFSDPKVRRKGRGLGLEIIRGAMREVTMLPGTSEGNLTVLQFDPSKIRNEEVSHGR